MGGKAGNIRQQVQLFHLSDSFPYPELLCESGTSKGYDGSPLYIGNHGFHHCDLLFIPGLFHGGGPSGSQAAEAAGWEDKIQAGCEMT